MPETKHAFIDDYPFIQYTDVADSIPSGSNIEVEALTATENKTYTAPEGKAYSPVTVNVAGGNPYDYAGITFATVTITGNTQPEGEDPVSSIVATSTVTLGSYGADFSGIPQQLTQLVVPVSSTEPTCVTLLANDASYMADLSTTTGTDGVTVDDEIYVTGDGTIDIVWTFN